MEHIQDIYKEKPELIENLLKNHVSKINLKVDGKPFQVLYNEETDELEFHGRSGNETTVGPLITDIDRYFSKFVNDAIRHIEARADLFKKYKFMTIEIIDNELLLTSVITKSGEFVNSPKEIRKIADELETEVMPTLWEGHLSDSQINTLMDIIKTGDVPTKSEFIKVVKELFDKDPNFPKKLIMANTEFIEGIVFFFDVKGKIVEYKLVDPAFRAQSAGYKASSKEEKDKNEEVYNKLYEFFLEWVENNGEKLADNRIHSIEKNFLKMMSDPKTYNKVMNMASGIRVNNIARYGVQLDRTTPELAKEIQKNGDLYKTIYEKFFNLFKKPKKRNYTINKEFQMKVNDAITLFEGMEGYEHYANDLLLEDEENNENNDTNDKLNKIKTELKELKYSDEDIKKITNYIKSLSKEDKNVLYNWCWLKYPDNAKINNFYDKLKNALRSSAGFTEFIELCKSQMDIQTNEARGKNKDNKSKSYINGYKLKDENDDSFLNIEFNKTVGSFNLKDIISKKWKNISDKTWNAIHNITFGPQPVTGKSEILFKTISHPGNNNTHGGDVLMFNNGVEVKDFGTSNAKLGRPEILNTESIFKFLGIKEKMGIGTTNPDKILSKIDNNNINEENFKNIFSEYFNNENIDNIISEISKTFINELNKSIKEKNLQMFLNIWGTFYLFCYSIIENFNIFISTAKSSELCFDYNYIVLNNKDKKLFLEIIKKQPFRVSNIRSAGGWIDITFPK